jgi:hypothetical protein
MSDLIAGAPEAPVAVEDGSGGQAAPLPARED